MNFLNQVILNNTIKSYLIVAVLIFLAILIKRFITVYSTRVLFKICGEKWMGPTKEEFDDYILLPIERLFLAIVVIVSLGSLNFPHKLMISLWNISLKTILHSIAAGILIIAIVSVIVRFMDYLVITLKRKTNKRTASENQLLYFFKDFIKVVIIIFGIVFVLKFSFGLNVSKLLTGLSIVGAALALAARESLENLIASFVIFFDKPFITGDIVKVNVFTGTVKKIGLRSTRITTFNGTVVVVPNKQMVDSILDNWSKRKFVQNELKVLLPARATADALEETIEKIRIQVAEQKEVNSATAYLQELNNDNAIVIVNYFTVLSMTMDELNLLRQKLNLMIKKIQEKLAADIAAT